MTTGTETAKSAATQLRDYELIFIVKPELDETTLEATINNVSQFIIGKGGIVASADRWGKKKLAYPIKHLLEGFYVLVRFKMDPAWSNELEAHLKISENIIRHLLVQA